MTVAAARLCVLTAALLFSTGGAAIKLSALTSWQIAGFRSGVAALVLWLLMPSWRAFWSPRALLVGAAYGTTLVLYVTANTLTTAANAIFLQTTAPLYVLVFAPWLLGERTGVRDIAIVGLLAAGLGLFLLGADAPSVTSPDPVAGNWIGATSGVTWALALLGLRWLSRHPASPGVDPAGAAIVAGNALAFLACLPFALPIDHARAADWLIVGYLGVFQIGLAYLFMVRGVRGVRALEVSLLLVAEPVLNTLWAWWVHNEMPAAWSAAGCALIALGIGVQAARSDPHS